jgi:hypothetical protein
MRGLVTLIALSAAIAVAAVARADGGAPSYVLLGGKGALSPDGKTRYVALTAGNRTIVSFIRVRDGRVIRWREIPGYFGVPVIALDATTDGVSADGRSLVLATPSGGRETEFVVVDTRTLRLKRVELRGSWGFDALSPDASTLYLIQYSGAGASQSYRVRAYDLKARRLFTRPVVDAKVGLELMRGQPITRTTTREGSWAYTLYARAKKEPFVHALDTVNRKAYCIDLPLDLERDQQMALRLRLRDDRSLEVRRGQETVAAVDTRTFVVHRH